MKHLLLGKFYEYKPEYKVMMVAEDSSKYGDSKIISREVLNMKYMLFYDETEHSRKINYETVTANNYL